MSSWFVGVVSSALTVVALAVLLWPPRLKWRVPVQTRARAPAMRYDAGDMALLERCAICEYKSGHHPQCPIGQDERQERIVEDKIDEAANMPERARLAALDDRQFKILSAVDNVIGTMTKFIIQHRAERGVEPAFDEGGRCTACRAAREDHIGGQCV